MARILVLDDDDDFRRVLARALRQAGYETLEAENGQEGLDLVRERRVDLVVTDLVMPEVDGIEFMRELARISPGSPVIAISGGGVWDKESLLTVADMLGAVRTVSKPFELPEFLTLVKQLLAGPKA